MRHFLLLLIPLLLLAACDTSDFAHEGVLGEPALQTAGDLSSIAEARVRYEDHPFTFDAVVSEVSRRHPGLKGVIGTGEGDALLVLLDDDALRASGAVVSAIAEAFERSPSAVSASAAPVDVARHPASFDLGHTRAAERPDFHELYDVRIGLRRFFMETDLVTMLDIDDEAGRVLVGTQSAEEASRLMSMMADDELAVTEFILEEPAVPLVETTMGMTALETAVEDAGSSGVTSSLRSLRHDRFRPLIGGAHTIPQLGTVSTRCTQGPAVRYGFNTHGFLTNAHCTFDHAQVNNVQFFQVAPVSSERTGTEAAVPPYRSGWFITNGYYSDVAFVRTIQSMPLRGQIANADNCSSFTPDCVENGITTNITGTISYLPVNSLVYKTGQVTGTSAGKISQVCSDRISSTGPRILCSSVVVRDVGTWNGPQLAFPGDSGSPVILRQVFPGSSENGSLAGVLWGGSEPFGENFIFSPWENIWQNERAGTQYGLPVQAVRASQGVMTNHPPPPPPPPPCVPSENQLCPVPND